MDTIPAQLLYTSDHEWVSIVDGVATIGITDFAVNELCSGNEGDLVYCDLPELGRLVGAGETFGEIESVKAVSDLNSPVAGEIIEVNPEIEDHLEILSDDPWDRGWLIKVKVSGDSSSSLVDLAAYEELVAEKE